MHFKKWLLTVGLSLWSVSAALAEETVTVVKELPALKSSVYAANQSPLAPVPLLKLRVGSITPKGWLRHQLLLEADGMTGHLQEISPWCKFEGNAWTTPDGSGENGWEEVPYWLRGYVDLGYVLNDPRIMADSKRWIEAIFAAQAADGWFGPAGLRKALNGKPDMWPHMPVLNALQSYYDVTEDARVLYLMSRYFQWQIDCPEKDFFTGYWDRLRVGDNLESVYWLYDRTGKKSLLDLATKIHKHGADWTHGLPNWHNVNVAEGFREPAEYALQAKDPLLTKASVDDYQTVMGTYGQVPGGGFGADENARPGFGDPRQGFETCGMVEFMHSFEMLDRMTGDPAWADRAEDVAFNDLPAALAPDLRSLHYLTCPNQVQLDPNNKSPGIQNGGTMFSYSPFGVYRCCQHNHGMGWPYYAEELWHGTTDGGLCASLYAASEVKTIVGIGDAGEMITLDEKTDYPFSDVIELKLSTPKKVTFPLYLRIPQWCSDASVAVNGKEITPAGAEPSSYFAIRREWADGDKVELKLPMKLAVRTWAKNKSSASVDYGPLTFSLQIGEKTVRYGGTDAWPETSLLPTTAWNYGLVLDSKEASKSLKVIHREGPVADQPFTPESTPITISATARKIENWTTDKNQLIHVLQESPVKSDSPDETVTLIPMGAARLRISQFPVIGGGADAHEWDAGPKPTGAAAVATASASFIYDDINALNSGASPASSGDQTVPRLTWWDHKGTSEWVEYDFKKPRSVSSAELYWFDDTGVGQCRVPESWRLLYRDGGEWKPVEEASEYATKRDQFNRVTFKAVETTGVRVEVKLKAGVSGGILQWKLD